MDLSRLSFIRQQGFPDSEANDRLYTALMLQSRIIGVLSGVGIAWALGATPQTILSLAPKSVTAGIAVGISEQIGGLHTPFLHRGKVAQWPNPAIHRPGRMLPYQNLDHP